MNYVINRRLTLYTSSILSAENRSLLWFGRKSGLECTKYCISPTFRGRDPFGLPLPMGEFIPPLPSASIPPSIYTTFYRPLEASCSLLFVRGRLLYSLLKPTGMSYIQCDILGDVWGFNRYLLIYSYRDLACLLQRRNIYINHFSRKTEMIFTQLIQPWLITNSGQSLILYRKEQYTTRKSLNITDYL